MGFGMDLTMVGPDYQSPLSIARTYLARFPLGIRKRAAEIIAEKNGIKSYELPMILVQAQQELLAEGRDFDFVVPPKELFIPSEDNDGKRTIIEKEEAIRIITYVKNDLLDKQLRYCTVCGHFDSHDRNCPLITHRH